MLLQFLFSIELLGGWKKQMVWKLHSWGQLCRFVARGKGMLTSLLSYNRRGWTRVEMVKFTYLYINNKSKIKIKEASRGAGPQGCDLNVTVVGSMSSRMNKLWFLYIFICPFWHQGPASKSAQYAMPRKFSGKWETESLIMLLFLWNFCGRKSKKFGAVTVYIEKKSGKLVNTLNKLDKYDTY